ncbi:MAG TPA: glycoside hydrolase family 3 N-terminal domain-containing protein, partial [Candidatus Saccharimonadales bacterium]|nr:glycoside hydrolase family 3 N-terminal domain-containing protein [Candidatus Saccharimonadales bacterium]
MRNESWKIAQDMIVGFDAGTPKSVIRQVVADTHIGGIFLTGTTDAVADGFTPRFYHRLSKVAGAPMLVASDEEGGIIHRLAYNFNFPNAAEMGRMSPRQVRHIGMLVGEQMRADGVYMDLAPVLDINRGADQVIDYYGRSFGSDTTEIAAHAQAFMNGLHAAGVYATLKHLVGLTTAVKNNRGVILDNSDAHKV